MYFILEITKRITSNKFTGIALVFILFMYSALIRVDYMNRPLGDFHEWITAHVLIALENLESQGALTNKLRIIQTYSNENDKYIWWVDTRIMDKNGIGFYTSYPPFSVILAYIVHKILFIKFSIFNLQILNLSLHLTGAVFMFLLVRELTDEKSKLIAPLISSSLYLFILPNLWYFSNIYSWDTIWHHFAIIYIFILTIILKKIEKKSAISPLLIFLLGISNFVTIYTELQGVFVVLPTLVFVYFLRDKIRIKLFYSLIISTTLSIGTTLWQYGTINGLGSYFQSMFFKLFTEYGTLGSCEHGCEITSLISRYNHAFQYLLIPFLFFSLLAVSSYLKKIKLFFSHTEIILLLISLIPVFIHHTLLLSDAISHEFNTLKFSIFLCMLFGIIVSKINTKSLTNKIVLLLGIFFLVWSISISIQTYKHDYAPTDDQDRYLLIGKLIQENLKKDEVGFAITQNIITPQIIYYAKRNIEQVKTREEAEIWLKKNNRKKGRIFMLNNDYTLASEITI